MTPRLLSRRRFPWTGQALLAAALAGAAASPWSEASQGSEPPPDLARHWHFKVLLDGTPIGEHEFTVTDVDGSELVKTRARFSGRAFFVPVYGYAQQDMEFWRDGCLAHIEAHTSDNGRDTAVLGSRTESGFEVQGPQGSFAYWDRARLTAARLLNSQSGEFEPVALTEHGAEYILSQGRRVEAQSYPG